MDKSKIDYTLYLCTDRGLMSCETIEQSVEEGVKGGCTVIQLREKDCTSREFYELAVRVKKITDKYNVPLIINDRLDIAQAVDCAGVHLGQSDMPCAVARKILGEDKIIGISAATLEEAKKAQADGADYLGVGAMYATNTKTDARAVTKEQLVEIRAAVDIPIVIIPAEMGVSYPCNAVWPLWALAKYRKINTVLSDLREKWGNMSSVWANNTLQEFWKAYPDEGSQWSHCAMYPLIALNQGIAGVYPLKPGCERIKMEPQLGDLEHIRFDVQTLKGAIQLSAQGIKGKRELRLQVPDSLSIELRLDKREKVDLPLLRTEKDGINVYEITHPGSYVLKLKYT